MTAVVLNAGARSYAFGLRWASASRGSLLAEAQSAAIAEGAEFVALHRGFNQFALATLPEALTGLRRTMFCPVVGAAAIAGAIGTAALAAFALDDGRWLVLAIDRKGILPDGDLVVADEAAARARIEQLIAQSPTAWRRKYLPPEWAVPDAKAISPEGLLGRSSAPRLLSVWLLTRRRSLVMCFAVLAATLTAGAFLAVRSFTASEPVAQRPFEPPKPVAAVWTPAGLAIDRCLSGIRDAQRYRAIPGWVTTKYVCQGGESVSVSLTRAGDGQISILRALAPAAQLSDEGRSAVVSLPLPALPRLSATAEFASAQRYRLTGLDMAQRLNGTFVLQGAHKLLPGETPARGPAQTWSVFSWTYQTQAPAAVWASAIARLGSIAIDTLSYSPSDNLWQLAGSLYAGN